MKRFWMHVVGAVSTMAGLAVVVPACAHDDSSFFLDAVLAPPQGSTNGCVFTNTNTQAAFSSGYVDVYAETAFANAYYAEFLAGNQLIPMANQQLEMTETSRIIIQGAVVTITDANGDPIAGGTSSFTSPGAGEVDPSNGGTPGYGPVNFELIDPKTMGALRRLLPNLGDRKTILTYTKAFGTTLGGDHVESNTFEFAVTACAGCLVAFDTDPTKEPQPNCDEPAPTSGSMETPCWYGQDVAFDCHACNNTAFCQCGSLDGTPCPAVVQPDAGAGGG
jgi:hypothetical protein